jgi:hypothetical protein
MGRAPPIEPDLQTAKSAMCCVTDSDGARMREHAPFASIDVQRWTLDCLTHRSSQVHSLLRIEVLCFYQQITDYRSKFWA